MVKPWNEVDRAKAVEHFRNEMQARGYKGLKYINTSPMETEFAKDPTSYIIFDPRHLKSATGNRGTFNPESQNILDIGGLPLGAPQPDQTRAR